MTRRMLEQYDKIRPISSGEWENLQIRFHISGKIRNWQITTFLTTKHGFPARIQKKLENGNCPEENMGFLKTALEKMEKAFCKNKRFCPDPLSIRAK